MMTMILFKDRPWLECDYYSYARRSGPGFVHGVFEFYDMRADDFRDVKLQPTLEFKYILEFWS